MWYRPLPSILPVFYTKRPEHNGEACIASLDPKDRGTERQFRFTRALLCTLLRWLIEDEELPAESVIKDSFITAADGKPL